MKQSLYTSAYNLIDMGFDWRATLDNWLRFLKSGDQIVIAVNTSTDDTFLQVTEYLIMNRGQIDCQVLKTDISYDDPLFDGKIKNEALRRCTGDVCTLLDMDEVLPLSNREQWSGTMRALIGSPYDALLIPVVDLFHDEHHHKGSGSKWYLHRNKPDLQRGRVNFAARKDGTTDISRSDTCELIYLDGSLVNAASVGAWGPEARIRAMQNNETPYVVHLGWLHREQRLRQSAFWAPVWNARNGAPVEKPLTGEDLDKIPYYPHNLKHWNAE